MNRRKLFATIAGALSALGLKASTGKNITDTPVESSRLALAELDQIRNDKHDEYWRGYDAGMCFPESPSVCRLPPARGRK